MTVSLNCPHCNEWRETWKNVERNSPKYLFDTWQCQCGGKSVWFAGAILLIPADKVDTTIAYKVEEND